MSKLGRILVGVLLSVIVVPAAAHAQGALTGIVRDSSGAVMPGVTVEAASPVLIEKVRAAVTDGAGQYRIESLRPGVYSVTFTLPGFSVVRREGIELAGSFVATVSVELKVGDVSETITVTGESPVVDVQSTTQQRVLGKDVIDAIPSGRLANSLATLIPGVTTNLQDVGGTDFGFIAPALSVHGSKSGDFRLTVEGLSPASGEGTGQFSAFLPNTSSVQEMAIDSSAASAESGQSGLRVNLIPREGSNVVAVTFFGAGAWSALQADNATPELRARGLRAPNTLIKTYDVNPAFGGPLVKDSLWFFTAARWNETQSHVGASVFNANAGDRAAWLYVPDPSRGLATNGNKFRSVNGRVTWNASAKNKVSVFYDDQTRCSCPWLQPFDAAANVPSPESGTPSYGFPMNRFATGSWTAPVTNRLLLEAGLAYHTERWHSAREEEIDMTQIGVFDQALGLAYRGTAGPLNPACFCLQNYLQSMWNLRGSASYITGSHSLKVGLTDGWASNDRYNGSSNLFNMSFRFNGGVPNLISMGAFPYHTLSKVKADLGMFVQDKWTIRRLTLNLGARFDYFNHYFPAQHLGPGRLVPNRDISFPETPGTNWKDVTPRMNAAYDLFGNGKTAVKASMNKYLAGVSVTVNGAANPVSRLANSVTRPWNDLLFPVGDPRRGNFAPDCDLLNPAANDECGAMSNTNFGKATPSTTLDPEVFNGWGSRGYNWEYSASVQHALLPRVSVEVGYFSRSYANLTVTDDRLVAPTDYSPFEVTAPVDARLPGGGGYLLSGLFDLNPNKVGQVDNFTTFAKNYGERLDRWSGWDFTMNARPRAGMLLQGGVSTGRPITDSCDVVTKLDNPSKLYCRVEGAFVTQLKLLGTYTVPKVDVQMSATMQNIPGLALSANYVVPNALVAPSLGRNLSGGANVTVNLIEPQTMFGDRVNQLDLRFGKVLRFFRAKTVASVDIFNALNSNPVIAENLSYSVWRTPQSILNPRYARFSVQFDF
jgi:hypothetical protein